MNDIRYVLTSAGIELADKAIESIAKGTCKHFDLDRVIAEISLDNVTSWKKIIKVINHNETHPPKVHCEECRKGFIYTLNRSVMNDMRKAGVFITTPLLLPKALTYCPNCGATPNTLNKIISKLSEEDQGWLFVVLYDFAVYTLQRRINPDDFNPSELWPSIQFNPYLTEPQKAVMLETQTIAKHRFITPSTFDEYQGQIQTEIDKATKAIPF